MGWLEGADVSQRRVTAVGGGVGMENSCSADEICGTDVKVREDGRRR